jgi:hypothetical protein
MIPSTYQSYTYFIRNKITGQFYYGSRYKNIKLGRTPIADFWIYYFTSSNQVKQLITQHGVDSFEINILKESNSYDECYWYEQELIKNNITNLLCLNKQYVDPYTNKKRFSFAGASHSVETKQKMSVSQLGENNIFFGRTHSFNTKEKMGIAQRGMKKKPCTEERKRKISIANTGKKRAPFTDEHKEKIRQANLGKRHPCSEDTKQKIKATCAARRLMNNKVRP